MIAKKLLSSSLLLFSSLALVAGSKTTFIPRSLSTDQVFELALTNYHFHHYEGEKRATFDIKPFFQQSFSGKETAPFFLPHNQSHITIREDGSGDVGSLWLNIIAAAPLYYQSTFTLKPQRTTAGFMITYYSYLPFITKNLWFSLNTALVHAKHTLHMQECDRNTDGTLDGFANAYDAFTNPAWCYGAWYCGSQSHTGIDDIQLKLGYEVLSATTHWLAPYLLATIPTSKKIKSSTIFEPLVGSHHGSFGFGIDADVAVWKSTNNTLDWMIDCNYRYAFASEEKRSFDLKNNGDWSRYLLVATESAPLNSLPGINFFTRPARITPQSTGQLWSAFHHHHGAWHSEIGYNCWIRAGEKVCLTQCQQLAAIGILDLSGICNLPATSASTAHINQEIIGPNPVTKDTTFTTVTNNDFDLQSAANTRTVTNKVYASLAYQGDYHRGTIFIALHGSAEKAVHNNALNQYAFWLQTGASF
jgi:hypothetical protein